LTQARSLVYSGGMKPAPLIRILPAVALLLQLFSPGTVRAGDTDALIDKVLAAHGGKAALAKVKGYRMEGTIASRMQGTGPLVRAFERPDRLRVVLDYPGSPEIRVLDGAMGWRSDGKGKLAPVGGFLLGSMVAQAGRANLPWVLDERRASARLLPATDGGKLQGIAVPLGTGLTLTAYVELATGRIVRSTSDLDMPGMKTGFVTDYSDFRAVDGVLFPFHEGNFASGQTTGETVVTKITLNPPLKDSDFRP
jgi:hypothetical protein